MPNNNIRKFFRELQRDINREARRNPIRVPLTGEVQDATWHSKTPAADRTTINNGPVFQASVYNSQLSWTTDGNSYQVVENVNRDVERLVQVIGNVLNSLPDLEMTSADRGVAQEAAESALAELAKPEDERERGTLYRLLAVLKGALVATATGMASGGAAAVAKELINDLNLLT